MPLYLYLYLAGTSCSCSGIMRPGAILQRQPNPNIAVGKSADGGLIYKTVELITIDDNSLLTPYAGKNTLAVELNSPRCTIYDDTKPILAIQLPQVARIVNKRYPLKCLI